jgi:hypothetical protein
MIDVSSIINDPDFNQEFNLLRVTGSYIAGVWTPVEGPLTPLDGIVLPAKLDVLKLVPEGERQEGSIVIYSLTELIMGDMETTQSDLIEYPRASGEWYRISALRYYAQCVLWYAVCTRYRRAS